MIAHPNALAAQARGADRLIGPAILLALGLLAAGWTLPLMTVSKLVWLDERISLIDTALVLFGEGEWLLFAVVAVFAVVFPVVKLLAAAVIWFRLDARRARLERLLDGLDLLGRWSMLDVFVAALLVVALKASLVSDVTVHAGLYAFTAAVVLSIATTQRLRALARRVRAVEGDTV